MANITNFMMRACIAGVSYLSLLVATRAGGLLNDLLVYAPLGLIAMVLSDRGRSERTLITGLGRPDLLVVRRELATFASAAVVLLLALWGHGAGSSAWIIVAVIASGLMQGPIDVLLASILYAHRSQRAVFAYQFAVNTTLLLGFCVAAAGVAPAHDLWVCLVFIFSAPILTVLFGFAKSGRVRQGDELGHTRGDVVGILLKLLPPATYGLSLGLWRTLDAPLDLTLRCLFFVYGFLHLSLMSRELASNFNLFMLPLVIAAIGALVAIPMAIIEQAVSRATWLQDIAALVPAILLTSALYAASLKLYGSMLLQREALACAQNRAA
jgi:hypothetical protein